MKSFLTSYSQPSLLSRLPSRIENRCCHKPTYLLKTEFLSFPFFTTCCLAPTRCNRFTCKCSTSASTANSSSKGFEPTQNRIVGSKPLHQDTHTKPEGRPFYPNSFLLLGNRNNPKSITAKNEFSVSGDRKRLPLGKKQHVPTKELSSARDPWHQDGLGKKEKKANRKTLCTGLCNAILSNPESLPARLSKSLSFKQKRSAQKENQTVFVRSLLPEKFVNLLMANGEKDKARRCLTQALFSITTHCQKHNLQNNSLLESFTDSFFKQESTESKPSSDSLKRKDLGTVQQETGTNELLAPLPKDKSNTLPYPGSRTGVQIYNSTQSQIHNFKGVQSNLGTKQNANPRNVSNPLRDVGLVLLESRLNNLSNNRYSGTKKRELYPSLKEEKGLLSIAKGNSISRLNRIERVEKRLVLKQNGSFFPFVKQKPPHFAPHQVVEIPLGLRTHKQIGTFKVPLSLPFCGKSFETTLNVFSSLAWHKKQNNPFLSLIRLSLKERFLTSEKGFASLTLHKKVQQSYLCSALLHLVHTMCDTTTQTQQIHFKSFLPYSALFNWRGKRLNPLFGFAKQSQRFLIELCKFVPNRVVKGTKRVRQNNLFGSFPLLSSFYSAPTPLSPFSFVPTPSITIKPLCRAIPNIFGTVIGLQNLLVGSKPWLTNLHKLCLQSNKQVPQNDSHSNTKDKETPLCFTQGILPVAKKVFERENHPYLWSPSKDIKSVHTEVLLKGIQRVQPTLEVRRVRKGRNTFQVPSVVKQKRGEKVGIKWIIDSAKSKKRKGNQLFSLSLANQLVQSFDRLGEARSKRNELLKLAESNRPFLRFRWW